MRFERIAILGVGLMGGSVGLACRALGMEVVGYGYRVGDLPFAVECGAISRFTTDAAEAVGEADLVIVCTPVGAFAGLLTQIAPALKVGAVVTDVGSTKRSIAELAKEILPKTVHFVGSHPMVGSEQHGVRAARAAMLVNGLCIVTPDETTAAGPADWVERFWQSLGMRTLRMTPAKHDQLTADASHLPHAIAAALVKIQSAESLAVAGRGFADTTRIAGGDPAVWRDIFLDNRDNLKSAISNLQSQLAELIKRLDAEDSDAVADWLQKAAEVKAAVKRNQNQGD
jgi:prephenate dehydrogenase